MNDTIKQILSEAIPAICLINIHDDGDIKNFIDYIKKLSNKDLDGLRLKIAKTRRKKIFIGFISYKRSECFEEIKKEIKLRIEKNIFINESAVNKITYRRHCPFADSK